MTTVVIKAQNLFDGLGETLADPVVVIKDSRIDGVYQCQASGLASGPAAGQAPGHAAHDRPLPHSATREDVVTFDFPDATILPGLINCHNHLNLPGDGTPFERVVRESDNVLGMLAARNAWTALHSGVTTLRDCGARGTTTLDLRRAIQAGWVDGPRLVLCGQPITITGGHCWYFGGEADGIEGLREKVRQICKMGADFIKIMGCGGGTTGTMSWLPSFSREEIAAAVGEAHRMDRKVAVHCLNTAAMTYAVEARADQIEHTGFLVDAAGNEKYSPFVAEMIARSDAVVCPTLNIPHFVLKSLAATSGAGEPGEYAGRPRLAPEQQAQLDQWQGKLEKGLANFGRLVSAGVKFVAGTDSGWRFTPFDAMVDELQFMNQGGLSALATLVSATSAAARACALDGKTGAIRPGLEADILVVKGDPMQDLSCLRNIQMVIKAGNVVSRKGASE